VDTWDVGSIAAALAVMIVIYSSMLISFALRRSAGLAPLFMIIGACEGAKYFLADMSMLTINAEHSIAVSSSIFFTASLVIMIFLYRREGVTAVRPLAWCFVAVALLLAAVVELLAYDAQMAKGLHSVQRITVGTVLLLIDFGAVIVLFNVLARRINDWLASMCALIPVLIMDTLMYRAFSGNLSDGSMHTVDIVSKLIVAMVYVSMNSLYHRFIERPQSTSTLATTSDVFALLTYQDRIRALEHDLHLDALTQAYNRRYLDSIASEQLTLNQRRGVNTALLMIDVDYFKAVNDAHGHSVGDVVLKHVVARIRACIRHGDVIARYGGEEFVVILTDIAAPRAVQVGEAICQEISNSPLYLDSGKLLSVTVSIGVARSPFDGKTLPQLCLRADRRLYKAKQSGRNRVIALDSSAEQVA
jgi:diguanylate cyclase (GGDEF)-like protein